MRLILTQVCVKFIRVQALFKYTFCDLQAGFKSGSSNTTVVCYASGTKTSQKGKRTIFEIETLKWKLNDWQIKGVLLTNGTDRRVEFEWCEPSFGTKMNELIQRKYDKYLGAALNALEAVQDPLWSGGVVDEELDEKWTTWQTSSNVESSRNSKSDSKEAIFAGQFECSIDGNLEPFLDHDIIGHCVTLNESGNEVRDEDGNSPPFQSDQEQNIESSCSHDESVKKEQPEVSLKSELVHKFIKSKGVCSDEDKKSDDQGTFQVIFKSLRSRSIVYNAIVGESREADLSAHRMRTKANHYQFPYRCDNCVHVFKFFSLLLDHVKSHGFTPKSFSCNICKFSGDKRAIKRHVLEKHQ